MPVRTATYRVLPCSRTHFSARLYLFFLSFRTQQPLTIASQSISPTDPEQHPALHQPSSLSEANNVNDDDVRISEPANATQENISSQSAGFSPPPATAASSEQHPVNLEWLFETDDVDCTPSAPQSWRENSQAAAAPTSSAISGPTSRRQKRLQRQPPKPQLQHLFSQPFTVKSPVAAMEIDFQNLPPGLDPSHGDLVPERARYKRQQLASVLGWILATPQLLRSGDRVVEFGGGSGHLGLSVAYRRPDVHVTIIELRPHGAGLARARAAELKLDNVTIVHGDMGDFDPHAAFDLGLGLHPCGFLTDRILRRCVAAGAAACIVPCCYGQLVHNYQGGTLPRQPLLAKACPSETFATVLRSADHNVRVGKHHYFDERQFRAAKLCMQLVDADRLLWMEENGYRCAMGSLTPLQCSPKNNVIIALPRQRQAVKNV